MPTNELKVLTMLINLADEAANLIQKAKKTLVEMRDYIEQNQPIAQSMSADEQPPATPPATTEVPAPVPSSDLQPPVEPQPEVTATPPIADGEPPPLEDPAPAPTEVTPPAVSAPAADPPAEQAPALEPDPLPPMPELPTPAPVAPLEETVPPVEPQPSEETPPIAEPPVVPPTTEPAPEAPTPAPVAPLEETVPAPVEAQTTSALLVTIPNQAAQFMRQHRHEDHEFRIPASSEAEAQEFARKIGEGFNLIDPGAPNNKSAEVITVRIIPPRVSPGPANPFAEGDGILAEHLEGLR